MKFDKYNQINDICIIITCVVSITVLCGVSVTKQSALHSAESSIYNIIIYNNYK